MRKRKGSLTLFTAIGIAFIFGLIVILWDALGPIVPFEKELMAFIMLAILFVMSIRIGLIWNKADAKESPGFNIDELDARKEKIAHKFVGSTSLLLIVGATCSFIAGLAWNLGDNLLASVIVTSFLSIFIFATYAQFKAVSYHNKYSPAAFVNLKRLDGYKEIFENLDEGEKFEHYRVAYKSFYAMNLIFPVTLLILFFVSIASSPQYVALLVVGILWFIMYIIYYREGAKSHSN
ncbi:DUF3169 family protein [Sporosarcina sp. Marseille-Q4063]|uniref:DUF3169 family protein n=1 Tax=Sporosarcina sp. Marseille-Q4063 TaxID=2810514 RepID=UPI001BB0459A|nr:DUF3169 family protein [Sporosarcina sp. Marseille-Q4063]QUW21018.1 DUF3169 family protein [Sporosarcina sp. Marseille-Q4063]